MQHDLPDLVGVPDDSEDGAVGPLKTAWELVPYTFVVTPSGRTITVFDAWILGYLEDDR